MDGGIPIKNYMKQTCFHFRVSKNSDVFKDYEWRIRLNFSRCESALRWIFHDFAWTNDKVISLAKYVENNKFAGFIEVLPAYSSLTIFFDVSVVRENFHQFQTAHKAVKNTAEIALSALKKSKKTAASFIEIPVNFDKEYAFDLEFIAKTNNLDVKEVIEIFTARTYRVYMLGFLPGFAYWQLTRIGRLAKVRRVWMRQKNVGIAGRKPELSAYVAWAGAYGRIESNYHAEFKKPHFCKPENCKISSQG